MPESVGIEAAIDALYQAPLDRFTADRNALAASLKKAGDTAGAARVKGLAKPSATAWAINQVWWRHRVRVEALLDAGARQRAAHVAWAQSKTGDVREAADARQRAVADVTEAALDVLGGRKAVAPDAQYRIAGTVEALATGGWPTGAVAGRLVKDLQASGLDALSALAGGTTGADRERQAPPRLTVVETHAVAATGPADVAPTESGASRGAAERAAARTRLDAAMAALESARLAASTTTTAEDDARTALDAATARRAQLEADLDDARAAEAAARRALSVATTAASRAEMDRGRAERDAARAREAMSRLS